jgi:hypothetical protein
MKELDPPHLIFCTPAILGTPFADIMLQVYYDVGHVRPRPVWRNI